jgi:PAS domain-containing protein
MPLSALESMEADVVRALDHINVPSYVLDRTGVIRWLNHAARRLVGDVEGRLFTSVVAPEETRRARAVRAQAPRKHRRDRQLDDPHRRQG